MKTTRGKVNLAASNKPENKIVKKFCNLKAKIYNIYFFVHSGVGKVYPRELVYMYDLYQC